jgi:DNA-directed RNA polymerase subunit RPC12/RpoP
MTAILRWWICARCLAEVHSANSPSQCGRCGGVVFMEHLPEKAMTTTTEETSNASRDSV